MSGTENIKIMCPNLSCGKVLAVPMAARGKTVRCRHCGTTIKIPAPPPAPAPAPENSETGASTDAA
jgi:ribosomal protein S27E